MLIIDDLTVRIAGRTLIENASARVTPGARVGLVGRNGTGKTTLFDVIAGRASPERGAIDLPPRCASAGSRRRRRADREPLIEIVLAADTERAALLARGRDGERPAPHRRDPDAARRHRRAFGAGARGRDPGRPRLRRTPTSSAPAPSSPAAGACAWRSPPSCSREPDLLLLDEPTNYLDLEGTLWLEDYLATLPAHRARHQPRPRPAQHARSTRSSTSTAAS